MICPYCSAEMKKGLIEGDGRRELTWKPKKECNKLMEKIEDLFRPEDEIKLTESLAFWTNHVDSYHCSACEKIIIDLKEIEITNE